MNKQDEIKELDVENQFVKGNKEMAQALNKYFINMGRILAEEITEANELGLDIAEDICVNPKTCYLQPTTIEVLSSIRRLRHPE